jgi:hypothetical protein
MSDSVKKWHEMNESGAYRKKHDPVVDNVVRQFQVRSAVGIEKYGKTLHENNLSLDEWLEHLKQELMDAVLYIQKAKDELRTGKSSIQ